MEPPLPTSFPSISPSPCSSTPPPPPSHLCSCIIHFFHPWPPSHSTHPSLLFEPASRFFPPQTFLLPCPTPAGLSEQEPLHLHFSGHCLANGLLICSIVPCEANSISASQSSLPVDSVIDWRNSCHRPAACSLPLSLPVHTTPPPRPPPCAQEAVHPCHLPKDLSPTMKNDRNI